VKLRVLVQELKKDGNINLVIPHQKKKKKQNKHRNCPERPSDSGQLYHFTCDFINQNLGI
jgi:hypothetical protein